MPDLVEEKIHNIALFPEENPFPVLRIDQEGILLYANRAAENLLLQWQCHVHQRVPDVILDQVLAVLENSQNQELAMCCDGRDFSFALVPIAERGYVNFYGRDITDQKKSEIALRESEERFRQLADAMPQLVWTADPMGNIDYCNRRFQEINGLEQKPDGYWEWVQVLHPDDRERTVLAWQSAVQNENVYQVEHRIQRNDGCFRWSLTRARPVKNSAGVIVKWYGTTTDIDDLKQVENALAKAKEVAEEANRAKSEFLANISHEIRTPITIFKSAIEYLLDSQNDLKDLQLLDLAEQSAKRLSLLLEELLDLSKIEARQMSIREERFDIRDCLKNSVSMMVPQAKKKNLHLAMNVSSNVPKEVVGDQNRIGQILLNLIGNAVKFTEQGSVLVTAECSDKTLDITVTDSGIGIPEDKLTAIFEPFNQVNTSSTGRDGGTGLGLAISKGLVKLMDGNITVKSTLGQGSAFSIGLPIKGDMSSR
ncbi:MAG: ATP-binding protein [Desulfuromonadales bacterium]